GRLHDAVTPTEEAVTTYRTLTATNPAHLPNLAGALTNLGIHYSQVGRLHDAVTPTEEAVTTYRTLTATNPAHLPNLAATLTNLGNRYSQVGRLHDAVTPTEEAVTTYRTLTTTNPAHLPNLADALNNLGVRYSEVGRRGDQDAIWRTVLTGAAPSDVAYLLLARASASELAISEVVEWVTTALRHAADDRALLSGLHSQARRHRQADPDRFDSAWTAAAGELPDWLLIEPDVLATARAWISTATFQDEHDFLAAHPELLAPAADSTVTEALLTVDEQSADRYLLLRDAARTEGVTAAYRPLLLAALTAEFAAANPATQATMLAERGAELVSEDARYALAALARQDDRGAVERADAILALAQIGAAEPALDALTDPAKFTDLMAGIAESLDPTALDATAFLARGVADTDAAAAVADFYTAVAAALAGDLDEASDILTAARRLAAEQTGTWINRLAGIGRRHPAVLALISVLTAPNDEPGAPA
ncbi:tetratricopeptide repeat protein, partial [Micromonospora chalcea]